MNNDKTIPENIFSRFCTGESLDELMADFHLSKLEIEQKLRLGARAENCIEISRALGILEIAENYKKSRSIKIPSSKSLFANRIVYDATGQMIGATDDQGNIILK